MKDSGIEWLPKVPNGWRVIPFKHLFKEMDRPVQENDEIITCFRDGEVTLRKNRREDGFTMADQEIGYQHVSVGDLVVHGMDGFAGSIGISDSDGKATPVLIVMTPLHDEFSRYFMYLLRVYAQLEVFLATSSGIRVRSCALNWKKLGSLPAVIPSVEEQKRIVAFLDERCAAIDEVRRTIGDEIEALRRLRKATIHRAVTKGLDEGVSMRDSGVDWIGEIPSSWTTMPLKQICTFGKGLPITKADLVDEGLPVVSYGQIHSKKNTGTTLTSDLCRHVEEKWLRTNKSALASKDDFLFADTSEDYEGLGNCAFVDTDSLIFAGYHTIIARPHGYSCPKYLAYLFRTDCWRKQIREKASGVKVFSATQSIFKRVSILVPTTSDQQRIADYLDERCAAIDSIIDTRNRQLDRLEDYRRAVVFAYVTGKKEVPSHE